jgi:hypothetical protein
VSGPAGPVPREKTNETNEHELSKVSP